MEAEEVTTTMTMIVVETIIEDQETQEGTHLVHQDEVMEGQTTPEVQEDPEDQAAPVGQEDRGIHRNPRTTQ